MLVLAAASIVNAEQSGPSVRDLSAINCLTGDVLNCTGGADGHHIFEEETKCPIGGETFKARYLGTYSTYGRHLDWEPVSYMRFPVPLPVCPSNGFIVAKKEYGKEEIERLKKVIESKPYADLYAKKHATYYLLAKMKELSQEKDDDLWWLYLNATWEADNCKNKVLYREYALETISVGSKRLAELKDSDEVYWVLKTVTADLYRRVGDFKASQDLIDKFGEPALKEKEANDYFRLAKKLLQKAVKEKNTARVPISDARDNIK
jgi:hypothetical protein